MITFEDKKELPKLFEKAKAMESLLNNPDFKLFLEELFKLRDEAHYMVLSVDVESKQYRARLFALDEIIGLPELIIKQAKIADEGGI